MRRKAFTLVELLVVIAIIGLLSTIAVVALGSTRVNARNIQRKANLVQISKALELYYANFGAYPSTGGSSNWHGACSVYNSYPDVDTLNASPTSCNDLSAPSWIPGLTSCGFMAKLPRDPNTSKGNTSNGSPAYCGTAGQNCYVYTSTGTDYKLIANCIPEGTLSASDPFADPGAGGARLPYAWAVWSSGASTW